jgi:hypothetical protein
MEALTSSLSQFWPAQPTFCTACDNPASGTVVNFLIVSTVLLKYKPSFGIAYLYVIIIICHSHIHQFPNDIGIFNLANVCLILTLLRDGRKLFGSTAFCRLCGFRHSEKITKAKMLFM